MASKFSVDSASRRLRESIGSNAITLQEREVLIMDAPALILCAETERLALEADITLIVVQACKNTRQDLLRAARSIERIRVPAIGVILDNVEVARAGSTLRRDLEQYLPLQNHLARFTLRANEPANES
jgi:Mrp family chromosome partitioning ATPase